MPKNGDRQTPTWLAPLLLMLLSAAVRAAAMAYPTPDADMAIIGLMARHILDGELPVFFYGEAWGGSIESFIAAPLFWLFGSSAESLSLAPVLVSLVFVWVAYRACADMWGRPAGLMAMALAALPPYYFAWHSVLPRGSYIEIPLLSLLLLWITFHLAHRQAKTWLWLAYGLVAGLGLWTHFLIIFALSTSGLYLLAADWRVLIRRSLPLMLAGFLAGSLPLWVFNLRHDWDSFRSLLASGSVLGAWEVAGIFFTRGLPVLLGVLNDGAYTPVIPGLSWGVGGLALAALGYLLWLRRRGLAGLALLRPTRGDGSELFLMMALITFIILVLQGDPLGSSRRHMVPLYVALLPLGGYAFAKLREKWPALAWVLALAALASNLAGITVNAPLFNDRLRQEANAWRSQNFSTIQEFLARDIHAAYALDFWVAPLLSFLSQERLVVTRAQLDLDDFHEPSRRLVERSGRVNWVCRKDGKWIEAMLNTMGASYQPLRVGEYLCFLDVQPSFAGLRRVPRQGWRAGANHMTQDADLALDGDALTRWSPLRPQKPGQQYWLDLGQVVEDLCLVRLAPGLVQDRPQGLDLEISLDGRHWNYVARMGLVAQPFHWDSGRTMASSDTPRLDIYFRPQAARHLRLTQSGESRKHYWSLQEINLYSAAPAQGFDPAAAVALALKQNVRTLYADTHLAAFAPRAMRPPVKMPASSSSWPLDLDNRGTLPEDLAGVGVAVTQADAEDVAGFLARRGIGFAREAAGGYALFHDLTPRRSQSRPLSPSPAETLSSNPGQEAMAFDGDPDTAWQTDRPRRQGDFWQADLGREITLQGLPWKACLRPPTWRGISPLLSPLTANPGASLIGRPCPRAPSTSPETGC